MILHEVRALGIRLPASSSWLVCAIALTSGCGERLAKPGSVASDEAVLPAVLRPTQTAAPPSEPPPYVAPLTAGEVEFSSKLNRFFTELGKLEKGAAVDDVRVVWFGDSHTAADMSTGQVRRALQGRFGDGGRGLVPIGGAYKGYHQDGVVGGTFKQFELERGKYHRGHFIGDGFYGLAGIALAAHRSSASATSEYVAKSSRIEVSYLAQPRGGSFDIYVDHHRMVTVPTGSVDVTAAYRTLSVPEGNHTVEVKARGDGPVRIFGVTLDRAQLGVTLDALGINGARVSGMLNWNEAHFAEQLRHRSPHLVVLSFGTNEAVDDAPIESHERHLVDVLGRVSRAVPEAGCLIVGPPDMGVEVSGGYVPNLRLRDIIRMQRRVADAAGCAFFDQQAAMGGEGAMLKWAEEEPVRAARDRVHFTKDGYTLLGTALSSALLRAFDAARVDPSP